MKILTVLVSSIEPRILIQVVSLLDAYAADLFEKGCPEILWKVFHMISRISFSSNIKPPLKNKMFYCLWRCFPVSFLLLERAEVAFSQD